MTNISGNAKLTMYYRNVHGISKPWYGQLRNKCKTLVTSNFILHSIIDVSLHIFIKCSCGEFKQNP